MFWMSKSNKSEIHFSDFKPLFTCTLFILSVRKTLKYWSVQLKSVAHWPEEYAKYPVFSSFEADFCTKNGNSPPQWYWRWELVKDLMWFRIFTRKTGFQPCWRPFFWTEKPSQVLWRPFFLWRSPIFGHKNLLNLIQDRSKSWSRSFDVVSSLQNSPPHCKFLAARLARIVTKT